MVQLPFNAKTLNIVERTLSVVDIIANNFFYVLICNTQELEDFYFKMLSKDVCIYLRVVSTFIIGTVKKDLFKMSILLIF